MDFPEWESFPDVRTLKNRTHTRFWGRVGLNVLSKSYAYSKLACENIRFSSIALRRWEKRMFSHAKSKQARLGGRFRQRHRGVERDVSKPVPPTLILQIRPAKTWESSAVSHGTNKRLQGLNDTQSPWKSIIYSLAYTIIIRCKFFFLFIGLEPTTWPVNNYQQIMVFSCEMSSNCVWLQKIFCLCVNETTLFSSLQSLYC